jgi:murein DD-endopeptidase MepM/ murein hydrolase activator NlpD
MAGAAAVAAVLALLVGSWWYLALRSAEVPRLEARLAELEAERDEIAAFADVLDELEARYEGLRGLLGAGDEPSGLWLPPPDAGRTASAEGSEDAPTAWPLGDRGFVTQSLLEEGVGAHPGIDIAVPVDTYVRAAGSGVVAEVGEDPVYGFYVALEHGQGYSSLYAHASLTFVELGQTVRRGEVIALSGSTGRSTAPHLHFEIQRGGEAVDPLTLVRPPA